MIIYDKKIGKKFCILFSIYILTLVFLPSCILLIILDTMTVIMVIMAVMTVGTITILLITHLIMLHIMPRTILLTAPLIMRVLYFYHLHQPHYKLHIVYMDKPLEISYKIIYICLSIIYFFIVFAI